MNIFITNECPIKSAKHLDNKRVNKMILESAQMLSTACREHGYNHPKLYKSTHLNHPSNVWCRINKSNYTWLYNHFTALAKEKIKRTGKSHKSYEELKDILKQGVSYLPEGDLTPFVNCAANKSLDICYKHIQDVTIAYQCYLNDRWDTDKLEPKWS